jgi:hypothetical protein
VGLLLAKGAAVDQASNDGFTPLAIAAEDGHERCVELLLAKGAAVNQATNYGQTPLFMATLNGHEKCVQLLLRAGGRRMPWGGCAALLRCRNPFKSCTVNPVTICCAASCMNCKRTLAGDDAELTRAADHDTRYDLLISPEQQSIA